MADEKEVRAFQIELRAEEGQAPRIEGYAATFNSLSEQMWGFREMIEPGFFDDVLGDDARALFNHDRNFVLGRKSNETLSMAQDANGLKVEIDPPPTQLITDLVLTPMRRGDINQMSFAFTVKPGGDDWKEEDGELNRVLRKGGALRLYDVSVVTEPAYPETSAQVRSKVSEYQQIHAEPDAKSQAESGGSEGAQVQKNLNRRRLEVAELKGEARRLPRCARTDISNEVTK